MKEYLCYKGGRAYVRSYSDDVIKSLRRYGTLHQDYLLGERFISDEKESEWIYTMELVTTLEGQKFTLTWGYDLRAQLKEIRMGLSEDTRKVMEAL